MSVHLLRARPLEELAVGGTGESWPAAGETVGSGGLQGRDACVCLYRQDCSGVGYWGTREPQPALRDGLCQQWSWALTPSWRAEQDEAVGGSGLCVCL